MMKIHIHINFMQRERFVIHILIPNVPRVHNYSIQCPSRAAGRVTITSQSLFM